MGAEAGEKPWLRICTGVLIGDAMHNLVDGLIIGTAFSGCSNATAWSIVAATIGHEIAQEIGDFIVLTNAGGLSTIKALLLNFLSGISVLVGAVIILSSDVSQST